MTNQIHRHRQPRTEKRCQCESFLVDDIDSTAALRRATLENQVDAWKTGRRIGANKTIGKSVGIILNGKYFITTAISGDPHASLAWDGVLMFLPVWLCDHFMLIVLQSDTTFGRSC